jgi:hypothetical protein
MVPFTNNFEHFGNQHVFEQTTIYFFFLLFWGGKNFPAVVFCPPDMLLGIFYLKVAWHLS